MRLTGFHLYGILSHFAGMRILKSLYKGALHGIFGSLTVAKVPLVLRSYACRSGTTNSLVRYINKHRAYTGILCKQADFRDYARMNHDRNEVGGDATASVGYIRLVAYHIDIVGYVLLRWVDKGVFYEGVVRRRTHLYRHQSAIRE